MRAELKMPIWQHLKWSYRKYRFTLKSVWFNFASKNFVNKFPYLSEKFPSKISIKNQIKRRVRTHHRWGRLAPRTIYLRALFPTPALFTHPILRTRWWCSSCTRRRRSPSRRWRWQPHQINNSCWTSAPSSRRPQD